MTMKTPQDQQEESQNNSSISNPELAPESTLNFDPHIRNNHSASVYTSATTSSANTLIAQHSTQPEISNLIYQAIVTNDIYELRRILKEHSEYDLNSLISNDTITNLNGQNEKDNYLTPLMIACTVNHIDIVKYLLKKQQIIIDIQDENGKTALFHATSNGNKEIVSLLSNSKANANIADKDYMTPLLVAANYGYSSICQILLEGDNQIDIDYQDKTGKSALAFACYQGHTSTAELLIKHDANINIVDKLGWTPLMLSSYFGRSNICYQLLELNADKSIETFDRRKTASELAIDGGFPHLANMIDNHKPRDKDKSTHKPTNTATSIDSILMARDNGIEKGTDLPSNFRYDRSSRRVSFFANMKKNPARYSQSINSIYSLSHQDNQDNISVVRPHNNNGRRVDRDSLDYKSIAESMKHDSRRISLGERLREEMKPRKEANVWTFITTILTFYVPNFLLIKYGNLVSENSRQAWKEKLAMCLLILMAMASVALLTIALSASLCSGNIPLSMNAIQNSWSSTGSDKHRVMVVRGKVYSVGDYFNSDMHQPISPPQNSTTLRPFIESFYGRDVSRLFPLESESIGCPYSPVMRNNNVQLNFCGFSNNELNDSRLHCHTSGNSLKTLESLNTGIHVSISWDEINKAANNMTNNKFIIFSSSVYNLTDYLSDNNNNLWLGNDANSSARYKSLLNSLANKDSTTAFERRNSLTEILPCLEHFNVGKLEGVETKCVVYSLGTIIYVGVFLVFGTSKLLTSVVYNFIITKRWIKQNDSKPIKNVIVMVPCYSETEESISNALKSLTTTDYPDQNKLLFIVVDGKNIVGKKNGKPTSKILKDLLDLRERKFVPKSKKENEIGEEEKKSADENDDDMEEIEPQPLSYMSIAKERGENSNTSKHNMVQIYSGYHRYGDRSAPVILVIKCGTPEEIQMNKGLKNDRSGNRGKRDSQMILFSLLKTAFYDSPMSKLEFELFEKIRSITNGITVDEYELMIMIDADTEVDTNSIKYLKNCVDNNDDIIALCGEAKITNKTYSWVTMIQVFEYFMSYNIGKPFESLFSSAVCLPGCFAMYRIYARNKHNHDLRVPILIDDYVFTNYFNENGDTLHQKNLLLGEDRYLTTLVLRTFPRRKIAYCSQAFCRTTVPETFSVLLSQRRRWINGTIHNQMKLLFTPGLPGKFCISVQFLMFLELFIMFTLPFALIYFLIYFIRIFFVEKPDILLIFATFAIYLMNALITLTDLKTFKWFLIYMISVPVWNVVLPLYSFWYLDDFSWGSTQSLSKGTKNNENGNGDGSDGTVADKGKEDERKMKSKAIEIKMKRWVDWRKEYVKKDGY